jgi:hypothetical protein
VRAALAALVLAAGGVGAWLVLRPSPAPSPAPPRRAAPRPPAPRLLLGFDDDTIKWTNHPLTVVRRERAFGARAVRIWVPWHGETRPGAVRRAELAHAAVAARRIAVVLAVFGFARETPLTTSARERFCRYARAALTDVPHARAVVVWNEANVPTYWHGDGATYESLLARCYDRLHALGATVLDSTASAHAPAAFLRGVGAAYRESGRTRPIVDAFGHNPYPKSSTEAPGVAHGPGFLGEGDYRRLVAALAAAFGGTGQRARRIWYLEDGFQSRVPAALRRHYNGHETIDPISPLAQARRLERAILLAACQPHVHAFFNFELVDETRLAGWQSGLVWRGGRPKPAAAAFERAARIIDSGNGRCRP